MPIDRPVLLSPSSPLIPLPSRCLCSRSGATKVAHAFQFQPRLKCLPVCVCLRDDVRVRRKETFEMRRQSWTAREAASCSRLRVLTPSLGISDDDRRDSGLTGGREMDDCEEDESMGKRRKKRRASVMLSEGRPLTPSAMKRG